MTDQLPIEIRPKRDDDESLIINSWLMSFRERGPWEWVPSKIFFGYWHGVVERLVREKTVIVACNPDRKNQILGWACYEERQGPGILHYCFTKDLFRGNGVCRRLLMEAGGPYLATFWTRYAEQVAASCPYLNWQYTPSLLEDSLAANSTETNNPQEPRARVRVPG